MLLADERNQLAHRVEARTADLNRSNADLARALRAKDEFLASMSHELRTPLAGILGLAESLQQNIYGDLQEKQIKVVELIQESGRHLLELINDILDLSKLNSGMLEVSLEDCSLEAICRSSLHLTNGMSQKRNQRVAFSFPNETILVHADARRLKQVLVNLLSNAIKFTAPGGKLGLDVELDERAPWVKVTVWDKGIGIKPEDMHKLFVPFSQIDARLSREYAGTGLGLSMVKEIVDLMKGSIQVESVFGEGSRFMISLPVAAAETVSL
jgi:signal transduction histidine kinase